MRRLLRRAGVPLLQNFVAAFGRRLVGVLLKRETRTCLIENILPCLPFPALASLQRVLNTEFKKQELLTNLMSSSLINRVISVLAFCTASSLAPRKQTALTEHVRTRQTEHQLHRGILSLTHTFYSQVDLAFSLLGLFAWREIGSPDGDGGFRVFTDPLQSFFGCHLPPGRLEEDKGRNDL